MITLISGEPGAGKTAYVVDQLANNPLYQSRPLFVMGIPDLVIGHIPVPPLEQWTKSLPTPEDPSIYTDVFNFPDGSVIVIDEAQKILRPRPALSRPPSYISAFETHRHIGLDFILITQSPSLIDAHVRKLVGQHIHVTGNWAGGKLYEQSSVFDPLDRSSLASAVVRKYLIPKTSFDLYKSSSIHTKIKRRPPLSFYVVAALLFIIPFLVWQVYHRINGYLSPSKSKPDPGQETNVSHKAPSIVASTLVSEINQGNISSSSELSSKSFIPRLRERPESAPLYDPIRQVAHLPIVKGCVLSAKKCICYTDQGTDAFLNFEQCKNWLEHRPYNPWGTNDVARSDKSDREKI